MAQNDFEIVIQNADLQYASQTATADFEEGEPVVVLASGRMVEAADDPIAVNGIAAMRSTDADGAAIGVGLPISFYPADPENVFRTRNFATDGTGAAAVPTIASVGDSAGLSHVGVDWSLDTGAANGICVVVQVLNQTGRTIDHPDTVDTVGVTVLFRFI